MRSFSLARRSRRAVAVAFATVAALACVSTAQAAPAPAQTQPAAAVTTFFVGGDDGFDVSYLINTPARSSWS